MDLDGKKMTTRNKEFLVSFIKEISDVSILVKRIRSYWQQALLMSPDGKKKLALSDS